jgi:hypothetical protein
MISNATYIRKLNKSQKVAKKGSEKMIAQIRIRVIPYFG